MEFFVLSSVASVAVFAMDCFDYARRRANRR